MIDVCHMFQESLPWNHIHLIKSGRHLSQASDSKSCYHRRLLLYDRRLSLDADHDTLLSSPYLPPPSFDLRTVFSVIKLLPTTSIVHIVASKFNRFDTPMDHRLRFCWRRSMIQMGQKQVVKFQISDKTRTNISSWDFRISGDVCQIIKNQVWNFISVKCKKSISSEFSDEIKEI